ncbi:hypothetical protein B0H14DRAFT_2594800 [Mycena olivaceomarginata]|nr:hypothetical protein B0H14DRAFT_2594800 [Mycena olivaceomarginata]
MVSEEAAAVAASTSTQPRTRNETECLAGWDLTIFQNRSSSNTLTTRRRPQKEFEAYLKKAKSPHPLAVVSGLQVYFDYFLANHLLYLFERPKSTMIRSNYIPGQSVVIGLAFPNCLADNNIPKYLGEKTDGEEKFNFMLPWICTEKLVGVQTGLT